MRVFQHCVEAARENEIWVATTGPAFMEARLARPDLSVTVSAHAAHPGIHGAYINACSLFAILTGESPDDHHEAVPPALVTAISLAGTRRFLTVRGFEAALGGQVVFHVTPDALQETHGSAPVSWQAFLRLRLPAGSMGRMWNMRMTQTHQMK